MSIHTGPINPYGGNYRGKGGADATQLEKVLGILCKKQVSVESCGRRQRVSTTITIEDKSYSLSVDAQGYFSAERMDGTIAFGLEPRGMGVPYFWYENADSPELTGSSSSGSLTARAKDMAQTWYEAAIKDPDGSDDDLL